MVLANDMQVGVFHSHARHFPRRVPSLRLSNLSLATMAETDSSEATPPPAAAPIYKAFDDRGDLQLLVGVAPDQYKFIVCSRALSRASPVFSTMLNGPWTEKQPVSGDWVVELPDDDPTSLRRVLTIIHGRFREVPDTIPLEDLHRLCICVDKYDITEYLRPWAKAWCLSMESKMDSSIENSARIAWVAWVLGNRDLLERSIRPLLWSSTPSSLTTTKAGNEYLVPLDSTGILDNIRIISMSKIQHLLSWLQGIWTKRVSESNPGSLCWQHNENDRCKQACSALILGSLTASLYQKGMLPLSQSIVCDELTLCSLVEMVKQIAEGILESMDHLKPGWHKGCGPSKSILRRLKAETSYQACPVLADANIVHLQRRARDIGVEY
ncbi:hypothetical protein RB594_009776 [Gaeumannomyces avenae]